MWSATYRHVLNKNMSEADALGAANIANNNAFLEELGFVGAGGQRSEDNSNRTTDKPGSKRGVPAIATIQRQSATIQRKPTTNFEYKCDKCNITKRFKSPRASIVTDHFVLPTQITSQNGLTF